MTEAIAENELIARRHMSYTHQMAVQWYCESLVYQGIYTRGYDCGNCGPYRCWDTGDPWELEDFVNLFAKNTKTKIFFILLLTRINLKVRKYQFLVAVTRL